MSNRRRRSKKPFLREWEDIPVVEQVRLRYRWNSFGYADPKKGAFLLSRRVAFNCVKQLEVFPRSPYYIRDTKAFESYKGSPTDRLNKIRSQYIPARMVKVNFIPNLDPLDAGPNDVAREVWTLNKRLKPAIAGFVLAAQPLIYDGRFKGLELWQAAVVNGSKIKIKVIGRADDVFGVTRFVTAGTAAAAQWQLEGLLGIMSSRLFREQGKPVAVSWSGGKWLVR